MNASSSLRTATRFFLAAMLFSVLALAPAARASQAPVTTDADLVIPLADMSSEAVFYPVRIDGNLAEFFAVKAPDGTVRVVVNACQACGPAGFYQRGEYFVCSACNQQFHVTHLEKQQGGCNPLPVGQGNKRVEADRIVLAKDFVKKVTTSRFAKERRR